MSELKPCPFCGTSNVSIWGAVGEGFRGTCFHCGGQTALRNVREDAVFLWNRRAPGLSQTEAQLDVEIVRQWTQDKGSQSWYDTLRAIARTVIRLAEKENLK